MGVVGDTGQNERKGEKRKKRERQSRALPYVTVIKGHKVKMNIQERGEEKTRKERQN